MVSPTATSFFFDEQRKTKQKESLPCIFLDPALRMPKGVEVTRCAQIDFNLIPCPLALLGEDEGD